MRKVDEYRAGAIIRGATGSAETQWAHLSDWFTGQGRALFVDAFTEETGLKIRSNLSADSLISAAIPRSLADLDKKAQGDAFYIAHANWFLAEMDYIIRRAPHSQGSANEFAYGNLLRFVESVLFDSYVLFEHWGGMRAGVPGVFGAAKNHVEHVMHFAQGVRQIIYGHGTFGLSFVENHSDLATATIRQMLEIRLRRAFGVIGKKSKHDGSFHPIGLSVLLAAVETQRTAVHFQVRFENLTRINSWANLYLHGGLKLYAWMPPRVLSSIWQFVVGTAHGGSKAGVTLSQSAFDAIRAEVALQTNSQAFEVILEGQANCEADIK